MIRDQLQKHGIFKVIVGITASSILLSVLITFGVSEWVMGESVGSTGITIAVIVPAILAPIFGMLQLGQLAKLIDIQEQLEILAITDDLTQVYNRRYFYQRAEEEINRMKRYGGWLSIALLDFDNFKRINDTLGHLAGDAALRELSNVCRQELRETDFIARYGGEEFVFLFPQTDQNEVEMLAKRLCRLLSETSIIYQDQPISLTVSIGTATVDKGDIDADFLVRLADQALYEAKQAGGNTVRIGKPPPKAD